MMDAVEYLKQRSIMTKDCTVACNTCPLAIENNHRNLVCTNLEGHYTEEAVAAVENWAKEHRAKTYVNVFLEKFPDADMDTVISNTCLANFFGKKSGKPHCIQLRDCEECWNREVKE